MGRLSSVWMAASAAALIVAAIAARPGPAAPAASPAPPERMASVAVVSSVDPATSVASGGSLARPDQLVVWGRRWT